MLPMTVMKRKLLVLGIGLVLVALAGTGLIWLAVVRPRVPPGLLKDIQAGLPARHLQDPDARLLKYLENRYGSMSDPTNREAVFVDFFNVERIKALQFLVAHSPREHRQANVDAMARWVEAYRESLTAEERMALASRFRTPEGQALLRRATAQYNSQDVRYRGSTAGVISQLLRTLNEVEQGQ